MCHVYRGIGDDLGRAAARGFGPNAAVRHTQMTIDLKIL